MSFRPSDFFCACSALAPAQLVNQLIAAAFCLSRWGREGVISAL